MKSKKELIPRKIFSVYIHEKEYDVYDIEGKEHLGENDMSTTQWLYFSDRLPDPLVPHPDSEDFTPFVTGINRRLWDIRIKQYNSHKIKWDENRFSDGTKAEMWCNNKLIYSFGSFGLSFVFAKIQYLQVILTEHPYNFFEPEQEDGRKICWYGLPATIRVNERETWNIGIIPDYTAGLNKEEWWEELKRRESKYLDEKHLDDMAKEDMKMEEEEMKEEMESDYINWGDALSDDHIHWFRK